jgi:cellulose synthase/poly-beta-1,6-N-acetylglucosamine synthase-like glycosyltransferase
MIFIFGFLVILYLIAMSILLVGFIKLPEFFSEEISAKTRFSIIVPFRNEAEHLPKLLESICLLKYPSDLYEYIFVNDASEDDSVTLIDQILRLSSATVNFRIIDNERLSASPKKDAITKAISIAKFDWILTTDADCILPENWLNIYNSYIEKHQSIMVAGPVSYNANTTLTQQFQKFDGLSLQLVTQGSFGLKIPLLCNGANLAYKKEAFTAVEGFKLNDHIASGDDIFMLEKMQKRFPLKVHYLKSKNAIVKTNPQKNWNEVISQRIRWASKTSKQKNRNAKLLGGLVFLVNLFAIAGAVFCIFQPDELPYYLLFLILKLISDFICILTCSNFFRSKINAGTFLLSELWYPFIIVTVVIAGFRGSYHWKGRIFQKTT